VKPDERSIYPNLKLTIYKTGIRQNRLAKMVGIHEAYLSRIVNGSREPGDALRQAIATALHSEVEWLFEREKVVSFPAFLREDRVASWDTDVPEAFACLVSLLCGVPAVIVVSGKSSMRSKPSPLLLPGVVLLLFVVPSVCSALVPGVTFSGATTW
jgi:transcriptional regulator with XRE-family HTH domain